MTPDAFTGLWRRRSVALGHGVPHEPASVHWIQWGDRFLDLRVASDGEAAPLSSTGCFGGTTSWTEPVLTWHHDLDSRGSSTADEGTISWLDGDLVEQGEALLGGDPVPYVEVWERCTPSMPEHGRAWVPWPGALAIEVDGHRMAALVHAGGQWAAAISSRRADGRWAIGDHAGAEPLLARLRDALLGNR